MKVVVGGASGMIGTQLREALVRDGHEVVQLVRRPPAASNEVQWDPATGSLAPEAVSGADAVFNLSGATLSRLPWTASYRRTILQSRVTASATIVGALHALSRRGEAVPALLSASAVGLYGSRPGIELDERAHQGGGFLADVVARWESEAMKATDVSRVVLVRTGLVLGDGGAGTVLRRLARWGVAGPIGGGRQHWPWVSLRDEVAAWRHLLTSTVTGPVNVVGPQPATAGDVVRELARQLHRPYWAPAPAFALRAVLRDAADDLLLADQRVVPAALQRSGFEFRDATVAEAIRSGLVVG